MRPDEVDRVLVEIGRADDLHIEIFVERRVDIDLGAKILHGLARENVREIVVDRHGAVDDGLLGEMIAERGLHGLVPRLQTVLTDAVVSVFLAVLRRKFGLQRRFLIRRRIVRARFVFEERAGKKILDHLVALLGQLTDFVGLDGVGPGLLRDVDAGIFRSRNRGKDAVARVVGLIVPIGIGGTAARMPFAPGRILAQMLPLFLHGVECFLSVAPNRHGDAVEAMAELEIVFDAHRRQILFQHIP